MRTAILSHLSMPADATLTAPEISIIIPACNEGRSIGGVVERMHQAMAVLQRTYEILVVNDGSSDDTAEVARQAGAKVITHPYTIGNGAAVKAGIRHAAGKILCMMDGDGQHDPADISRLLARYEEGFAMVVGARQGGSQASRWRGMANAFYNRLASYMTGHRVEDLTSGYRVGLAEKVREFVHLLPNGFSYPTTITMAFFRAGYPVAYVPLHAAPRIGKSHIRPLKDGMRFLLIIFKIGTLYSPLKLFVPVAFVHCLLGLGYYAYTFASAGRLSIMTVFMLTAGVTIFLIGLVSEQITQLMYMRGRENSSQPRTPSVHD